ncbi:hypothetical protein [Halotia branconii]|uniref:Uncharacterized protein n=1 Tax=Halotia branconii CENA392 TaxID=1539056 RepID=A0AAJ6NWK8_9CYAN|nr:hypothetical protein [Halotia branconii]WGV27935.1 hypothetical protein QI031_10820 [Halotia branconii CENA392]
MRLIKKFEKPIPKQTKTIEKLKQQNLQVDIIEMQESNIPLIDHPVVESVGNSGWEVSDIWKDIRLDSF